LSHMYFGALVALSHTENPDHLAQSAHSIRELMEKIPAFLDVQTRAHQESLSSKVRELEDSWQTAIQRSASYDDGNWNGEIDQPLSQLLEKLQQFFNWLGEHRPRRRAEVAATLHRLDGSDHTLPKPLEELEVERWMRIRDFFQAVSHHRKQATRDEFEGWLDALEMFLLDRLEPRTFADFDTIDEIIEEGQGGA
jgi:hypothetical protein